MNKILSAIALCSILLLQQTAQAATPPKTKPQEKKPAAQAGDPVDAYIKMVSPKIQKAWKTPETTTADKVVVTLTIAQDGKINAVDIKEPSGDQAFDDATVTSLKALGQLPPMPASAKDGMKLTYTFYAGEKNQSVKADNDAYVNAFGRRVHSQWHNPKVDKDYQTAVSITVDKTGKLLKSQITKPSGNKLADQAAMSAAKLAEPYPAIPAKLGEKITINYTFRAGPSQDVVNKMKFNGVPLPQGDYQISSGGAQLRPLDVDTAVNRKLQERELQLQDRMLSLKAKAQQEESKSGAKSIQYARAQHEIGNCAVELHDYKEAESAYNTALVIVESDASQAQELHSLLADIAQMYVSTARLKEAEPFLSRACELAKTASGIDPQKHRKVMEDYARLLYKLNRTTEADGLYRQLRAKP